MFEMRKDTLSLLRPQTLKSLSFLFIFLFVSNPASRTFDRRKLSTGGGGTRGEGGGKDQLGDGLSSEASLFLGRGEVTYYSVSLAVTNLYNSV